jgi:hypothetical protein
VRWVQSVSRSITGGAESCKSRTQETGTEMQYGQQEARNFSCVFKGQGRMSTKNYYWDKGYKALEILYYVDLDEEDYDKDHFYTNTVDMRSLGCLIYQIRACYLPFQTLGQRKRFFYGKAPCSTELIMENRSPCGIKFP